MIALMNPILDIAKSLGLVPEDIEQYGPYIAKITRSGLEKRFAPKRGKYVVVTAITPTASGEGKTTVAIGLGMALRRLGKKGVVTLRQPSLGPLFGMKGGGAGGGAATLLPHEAINLALTGDNYRVTAAHNLLSSFIDNHIYRSSPAAIDPEAVFWPRAVDINDRALREIIVGANEKVPGFPRRSRFVLTEASEVMAILSLSSSLKDMRERLGRILVALDKGGQPVSAEDIRCAGAMAVILRDALRPNLIQTSEGTPAFIHTGPFANIAPGISSLIADQLALTLSDYVITEAGFGADLGFEKLVDIKCRIGGLYPDCAVLVCTVKSLKAHGGNPDGGMEALEAGMGHLKKQIENVQHFRVPIVVMVNRHPVDTPDEVACVCRHVEALGVPVSTGSPWKDGGAGLMELGEIVGKLSKQPASPRFLYDLNLSVEEKIRTIAATMYGAKGVEFSEGAKSKIHLIHKLGFSSLPVCMAKTHRSLSHDPKLPGTPEGFTLPIDDIQIAAGAGFIYPLCGKIYPLPGLPSRPLGEEMDIDTETWGIKGL
ncbi:MAG: formate--tetrahydrofolate ligase [Nitrospirae bacterium]|nr:formate--tetrahydrofolate ligase [Nitrospirota bacterium]MBI5097374.1 formate--tetrahydrofolate ligase [Nitrospirota bacterium]